MALIFSRFAGAACGHAGKRLQLARILRFPSGTRSGMRHQGRLGWNWNRGQPLRTSGMPGAGSRGTAGPNFKFGGRTTVAGATVVFLRPSNVTF